MEAVENKRGDLIALAFTVVAVASVVFEGRASGTGVALASLGPSTFGYNSSYATVSY
jgi:hypothetical protein